jgi:hypothetical protein
MRLICTSLVASVFCVTLIFVGCSSNTPADHTAFPDFQECFNDHHVTEMFTPDKAITICCLDHPIGSAAMGTVCGTTAAACMTYVTANIMGSDATAAQVTTGCTDYIAQRGM